MIDTNAVLRLLLATERGGGATWRQLQRTADLHIRSRFLAPRRLHRISLGRGGPEAGTADDCIVYCSRTDLLPHSRHIRDR